MTYEKFEHKAISILLDGNDPTFERLFDQFLAAEVLRRKKTEVGFVVDFQVQKHLAVSEITKQIPNVKVILDEKEVLLLELEVSDGLIKRLNATCTSEYMYSDLIRRLSDLKFSCTFSANGAMEKAQDSKLQEQPEQILREGDQINKLLEQELTRVKKLLEQPQTSYTKPLEKTKQPAFERTAPQKILIEYEKLTDLSVTVYYHSPYALTFAPLAVDDLKGSSSKHKTTIDGSRLVECVGLLKQLDATKLIPARQEFQLDVRLHYTLENEKMGQILSVTMWGENGTIIANGLEVEEDDIFYDIIIPFLPEDHAKELGKYLNKG